MQTRESKGRARSAGRVFRLNGGATTFGRGSTLSLNSPGGSFMAGRPAGGGIGAGADVIARALAGSSTPFTPPRQDSVQGPVSDFGPPLAAPSPVAPTSPSTSPRIPTFTAPSTTSQASTVSALFPRFEPVVQPAPRYPRYF